MVNSTEVNDLSVRVGINSVIEELTFTLPSGQNLLITGANGSGKTTLLRALAGEITPTKGFIRIQDPIYLPADPTNPRFNNVDDYLALVGSEARVEGDFGKAARTRVLGKPMSKISSGEFKAIALARTLSLSRATYLLDEPSITLDSRTIDLLIAEIRHLNSQDRSFIVATNNPEDFGALTCEKIVL